MGYIYRILFSEKIVGKEQEFYWLWIFAGMTYGVGDMVTTITILEFDVGVNEANFLVQQIFSSWNYLGLIGLKLAVFSLCITISVVALEYWNDRPMYFVPPLILTGLGSLVTANNLYLLFG